MDSKRIEIKICMGSSCHLKGSYEIVERLKKYFENEKQISLKGSLCMNNCTNGVCIEINGVKYSKISLENLDKTIIKEIEKIKLED